MESKSIYLNNKSSVNALKKRVLISHYFEGNLTYKKYLCGKKENIESREKLKTHNIKQKILEYIYIYILEYEFIEISESSFNNAILFE